MNNTFIQHMKTILLDERKRLLKLNLEEIHIDVDGDEVDEIQGNLLKEMNNQLTTRNNEKLERIEAAIDRIDKNEYGLCEDCGDPIPEKRIEANPYITVCVCCAEDREKEAKQRKRY